MKIKNNIGRQVLLFLFVAGMAACSKASPGGGAEPTPPPAPPAPPVEVAPTVATVKTWLVDKSATDQTAALFYNLKKVAKTSILFGHQDATKRGVTNATTQWANEQHLPTVPRDKSDVKEVTGAYPAVYGHDFIHIANFEDGNWFDYERDIARQLTIDAYNRGGVNTFAWHYFNPVSKGSFYWKDSPTEAVSKIIPGGSHHEVYKNSLKEIADFAKSLVGTDGKLVPVIFRPFHEFDGDWFWWGKGHTTAANYITLYQFTVTYLRDVLGVHNFLYAWSPDRTAAGLTQFLEWYPGDAFVDVVGMDNYWDLRTGTAPSIAAGKLKMVSDYAKSKGKVAALTETGLAKLEQADWYTNLLLKVLQHQPLELAYVMVWANTKDAFWTPYKGHAAEADFKAFKASAYVRFADEAPNMYEIK